MHITYTCIYTYAHVMYINSINTNNATFAPCEKYFYDDSARDRQYDVDIHLLDTPENINISTTIYTIIYTIIFSTFNNYWSNMKYYITFINFFIFH